MSLLIQYTLLFAAVLSLVALGGCFSEHSGVINLGLEGIMIVGALGGAVAMALIPTTVPAGVMVISVSLIAIAAGVLYSVLLGFASINFKADQTLIGTAMNMLATAAATIIARTINASRDAGNVSNTLAYIDANSAFTVNIGSFRFNWFMLMALAALLISHFVLYKTKFGLRLRACGDFRRARRTGRHCLYYLRRFPVGLLRGRQWFRLPGSGCYDLRSVETRSYWSGCSAVRFLPCLIQCLFRLRLAGCDQYSFRSLQHDAVYHFSDRSCLHFQEFCSS